MESVLIMDNDSGYVSHNHESNLDCLSENATRSYSENDIYICEDALLEKPLVKNVENCDHFESVDSVINCSQESIKTEFSGFEDSDQSDTSLVIPVSKQIVWNTKGKLYMYYINSVEISEITQILLHEEKCNYLIQSEVKKSKHKQPHLGIL
jgi:hypothetical protein